MSWMQKLYETYENASRTDAVDPDNDFPLSEPGFITGKMPLTITLSADGMFLTAERLQDETEILVPCTLQSGVARQYPVRPHPIFDAVKNMANPEQLSILKDWCEEPDTPEPVKIVYAYLQKRTFMADLESELTIKKAKWSEDDGVKFCVISSASSPELWRNRAVLDSWVKYFQKHYLLTAERELCYVLGKRLPCVTKHPYAASNWLLISMSSENCSGRFLGEAARACSISGEASLKSHSALKWLINRQGKWQIDKNTIFLAWATGGDNLPSIQTYDPVDELEDEFGESSVSAPKADTWPQLGMAMASGSSGFEGRYLRELSEKSRDALSDVVVMILGSATGKGRASVVYYQELHVSEYIDNLMHWYTTCRWPFSRKGSKAERDRTPLPEEICNLLYGTRNGEGDKKLKRQLIRRLIPCITDCRAIPADVVQFAFYRTVNPLAFKTKDNKWDELAWKQAIGITCAMIRKQYEQEAHPMALDEINTERNYLYGRLLAVADVAESRALSSRDRSAGNGSNSDADDESAWRQTNAVRYMQRFQQRPQETWMKLYATYLPPYLNRLKMKGIFFTKLIDEIIDKFLPGEMNGVSLDGRFLEGYSCQRRALQKGKKNGVADQKDEGGESNGGITE
jgi:CRISPR-associated protein Csd1